MSILVALVVFSVSFFFAWESFLEVKHEHQRQLPTIASIPYGQSYYELQYQNLPVGYIEVLAEEVEETFEVKGTGILLLSIGEREQRVGLSFSLHVNSVGQLGASIFRVTAPDVTIVVGTAHINPIKITLKVERGEQTYSISRPFPGPVRGEAIESDAYRFLYAGSLNKLFVRSDRESFPLPFEFKELDSQQYGERKRVMPQPLVVEELYQAMVQEILSVLETLRELNPALIPPNVAEMLQEVQKQ